MSILKLLFELFVIYIIYKLIFDFIIPVYKTTKVVKQKVDDMQQRMQQNQQEAADSYVRPGERAPQEKPLRKDYIDYEEIK